jgi:hypothetical protein
MKTTKQESANAKTAYQDYQDLGPSRSPEKLMMFWNNIQRWPARNIATVHSWMKEFNWEGRAKNYDAQVKYEQMRAMEYDHSQKYLKKLETYRNQCEKYGEASLAMAMKMATRYNQLLEQELSQDQIIRIGPMIPKFIEAGLTLQNQALGIEEHENRHKEGQK